MRGVTTTFPQRPGPNPVGATSGHAWTADGAGGADWAAVAGGASLKTPDGLRDVSRKRVFDPYDFDAAGSDRIEYVTWATSGTTTFSTKTAAGAARDHDFEVNQYVAIFGAGAACSVATPPVTGTNATLTLGGSTITFTASDTTDIITTNIAVPAATGDEVRLSGAALPGGTDSVTSYFLYRVTADRKQWKLYDSAVNALAGGATGLIDITSAGTPTHTLLPYTLLTYAFTNGDGKGGQTAASATVSIRGWNNPTRINSHYVDVKVPLSRGATSAGVYGRGASNRQMLVHLDTCVPFNSSGGIHGVSTVTRFTSIATNSGGARSQLLGLQSSHGIVAGDYVLITASDAAYNVRAEVITANANDLIIEHPFTATATGSIRPGHVIWRDYGPRPSLNAGKYLPDVSNSYLQWTPSRAYPVGAICYDPTSKLWFRCIRSTGLRMSGTSAPTWPTAATGIVVDNELTWKIDPTMYSADEPATETRQTLLTRVTAKTSNTFQTADAAQGGDVASVRLVCAHNDAIPIRATVAAAKAYGRNCTINFGAGYFPCYIPSQTDTNYWDVHTAVATHRYFFMNLSSGVTGVAYPKINIVCDPGAWIAARFMQVKAIPETTGHASTNIGSSTFILQSTEGSTIEGGVWEWGAAQGGRSEVGAASHQTGTGWLGEWSFLEPLGVAVQNTTVRDVKVHWPNIGAVGSIAQPDRLKKGRHHWTNCELYYGGSDGDFTMNPYGDFQFIGGEIRNVWRYGSHGLYPGADVTKVQVAHCRITDVSKFALQFRAEGGNAYSADIQVDHVIVQNSGAILVGDQTSSNREYRVQITGCIGANLILAECRGVSVIGGTWGTIQINEDCERIEIAQLTVDNLYCNPSDLGRQIHVTACDIEYNLDCRNLKDSTFTDVVIRNACPRGTSLISGLYEWEAITGLTDVYRAKVRSADHDPVFTAVTDHATTMRIRDVNSYATLVSGNAALGAISDDQWYFGNTELQQLAITGTPGSGTWTASYNGAGPTSGIALGASAATVQTALRTLTGLSLVTVTQSGSGNNLTYTVAMTGVVGEPPQITVAHTFNQGTITASTLHPYPGYNTYAVKIGDSLTRDPDSNPVGTVSVGTLSNYEPYLYIDNVLENVTFRDLKLIHDWGMGDPGGISQIWTNKFGGPSLNTKNVQFLDCNIDNTGTSTGLPLYMIELDGPSYYYDITFRGGRINGGISGSHHPLRADFVNGGKIRFIEVDLSAFNTAGSFTNAIGNVDVIRCRIQTNRCHITPDAATEAWNINGTYSDATFDDGGTYHPIVLQLGLGNAYPTTSPQVTGATKYYWRTSNKKLYLTETDAINDANVITITSVASTNAVVFVVLDFSRSSVGGYGSMGNWGDTWGIVDDNWIRDSQSLLYTDPGSDQNNYVIHRWLKVAKFDNAAARIYKGFDAPAAGTVEHEFVIENNGAYNLDFWNNSSEEQTIAISGTPTGGNFIITHTGGSTAAISHTTGTPASAATVQAALRLVPGLGLVTVTQSGSGTDLTYTVKMNGFNSDPAQFTSTNNLTGGTPVITHATPVAYTAEWINQLYTPGGTTLVQTPGTKSIWRYDVQVNKWRGSLLG